MCTVNSVVMGQLLYEHNVMMFFSKEAHFGYA